MHSKSSVFLTFNILFLFFFHYTHAQAPNFLWAETVGGYSDDKIYSVVTDASGNIYATGFYRGPVDFDPGPGTSNLMVAGLNNLFVWKLNASGNLVWVKSLTGPNFHNETGYSIALDNSGNICICGNFDGQVDFDPGPGTFYLNTGSLFITKLDSAGNFIWAKEVVQTPTSDNRIATDPLGNVYVTGNFSGSVDFDPGPGISYLNSPGNSDIFILKLDPLGNFITAKQFGNATGSQTPTSIAIDLAGSVYITGKFYQTVDFDPGLPVFNLTSASLYHSDIFICKLDSSGNFAWAKAFGGIEDDVAYSIAIDKPNGQFVYTTGYFNDTVDFDPGPGTYFQAGGSMFISKFDTSGNFIWSHKWGDAVNSCIGQALAIQPTAPGYIYLAGIFVGTVDFDPGIGNFSLSASPYPYMDPFVAKLDSSGNFLWAKSAAGTSQEELPTICVDATGHLVMGGCFLSPTLDFGITTLNNVDGTTSSNDIYIARLDNLITGIDNQLRQDQITLFPNPSNKKITLCGLPSSGNIIVEVYNLFGEACLRNDLEASRDRTFSFDISDFPNGIYFVQLKSEYFSVTKKMVVAH